MFTASSSQSTSKRRDQIAQRPQTTVMLSRVAGSLYWMSRNLERAENIARLLDVNFQLLLDFGSVSDETLKDHWVPVLRAAGEEHLFFQLYETADSRNVMEFMTFRQENPNSVISCINSARENARHVRDQISQAMWQVLNDAYLFLKDADQESIWDGDTSAFYDQIKKYSYSFQGLTDSTFSRNEGYEFIQFGKFIERADKTARIVDIKYHILLPKVTDVGGAVDAAQWHAVLRSVTALEAYRRYHVAEIVPWKVAEFLIFSESFPRSIRYCVEEVHELVQRISGAAPGHYMNEGQRRFGKFLQDLRFATKEDVLRQGLHQFLQHVMTELAAIANDVFDTFMYHPPIDMAAEIRLHQQERQQQQQGTR